jgi:hypothetical protein
VWDDRVQCALGALASMTIDADDTALRQAVAAQSASWFGPGDRLHNGAGQGGTSSSTTP